MVRMAGDLLKLYAERQLARAPAIGEDSDLMRQFESLFEFDETPDQLSAATAIRTDLEQESPMDRLLVGDVGFGKTEVAMRAAFKTVDSGYQVAVLAPTTILADQHLGTFRRRFAEFPVRIEMVSRFRSAAEIRDIRTALAAGKVDILIGTHRLLSRDIEIPRLGLLVVDEEQRFGVAQKERLRQLKKTVHVLSMTATPVPRTLQLSLVGVRDLSLIETPPRDRMAVDTAIVPFDRTLIREAIEFERERGGQIYFVYNRVEGIEEMAGLLRELVPDLSLTIGHGQMDEGKLAERMHAFKRGDHDLLLATTIIENGIDIPNVNTMLIHRADRFGAGAVRGRPPPAAGDPRVHRSRSRLSHRRSRPRDPRRRQSAGCRAERSHHRGGHRGLSQDARGDGARAQGRNGGGTAVGGSRPAGDDGHSTRLSRRRQPAARDLPPHRRRRGGRP
jgi:transcription-repair coupling factor (superfamily II helicase)